MINRSLIGFFILSLTVIGSCSKNQDDVDLPIYDAIGGDFTLPSTLSRPFTLSDYQGQVVLVNFGYTSCPDICPMVLIRLAQLNADLESSHQLQSTQVKTIFITVDPDRDSIPILKDYLAFFNKNFIGISGTNHQILELAKKYAVFIEKQKEDKMGYQVAHSDKIFLLDKAGRLRGLYGRNDADEKIISAIVSLSSAKL